MSGPKLIRPVLDAAIARSLQLSQMRLSYSVLVILCCAGTIHDAAEVMEKLSQASYIPLSVVLGEMPASYEYWKCFIRSLPFQSKQGDHF